MDTSQLAVIRQHVEDITADLDVWADRQEPDARARRYASAAVASIDAAFAELHAVRARLLVEIDAADNASAARADALLAVRARLDASEKDQPSTAQTPLAAVETYEPSGLAPPPGVMAAFRQATDRAPEPIRLDGCTCAPVRGSHKPPCQWAMRAPAPRTEAGPCFGPQCDHVSHQWSAPPALDGYGYTLPEDYLRGGAQ
jgi:hypothetical protein